MKTITLGILGGLGPMSGIRFCEMLTEHTLADRDQQHLNFLLSSRADTPDRTDFILKRSTENPIDTMIAEVQKLILAGADLIAIPCNTAHHFYDSISDASSVPVINIIDQTVEFCRSEQLTTVGILATEGTVASGAYANACLQAGISCLTPSQRQQEIISRIIYDEIKKGKAPNLKAFSEIAGSLAAQGCEAVILGCTELSLLRRELPSDILKTVNLIDSLEVLAYSALRLCGKPPVGFDHRLMNFTPKKGTRKEKNHVVE